MVNTKKLHNDNFNNFLFLVINHALVAITVAYNIDVDNIVAGILSHTEKEKLSTNKMILLISQTNHPVIFPIKSPTNGIHESAINAISANKIISDRGTKITLVNKNKLGN